MRIRNLLGLGDKSEQGDGSAGTKMTPDSSKNPKKDKIPAHVQDSCCGSCVGGAFTGKKELPNENA